METTTNDIVSQENESILRLKRPLLPIGEYAAREGVSMSIVRECGKLGIVPIRKFKGKTFVVDVPLGPYHCTTETTTQPTQPADKAAHAKTISELAQKAIPGDPKSNPALPVPVVTQAQARKPDKRPLETTDAHKNSDKTPESGNQTLKEPTISALVKKMLHKSAQITDKPAKILNDEIDQIEDIPDSAKNIYTQAPETTDQLAQLTDDTDSAESIPESIQIPHPQPPEVTDKTTVAVDEVTRTKDSPQPIHTPELQEPKLDDEPLEFIDEIAETEEKSEPAQATHLEVPETTDESDRSGNVTVKAGKISRLIKRMFRKASKITSKLVEAVGDKTVEAEEKSEPAQTIQDNETQFALSAAQAKSKRTWQIAAVFLIVSLFAILFSNLWLYMDRKIQIDRLHRASASIQTIYQDAKQADQRAETLQNELANSKTELVRLQNKLDNSRAEVKTVQDELTKVRQDLQAIRQRNTQAVERLNEQIQRLTTRLIELTKNPQAPSDTGISGN